MHYKNTKLNENLKKKLKVGDLIYFASNAKLAGHPIRGLGKITVGGRTHFPTFTTKSKEYMFILTAQFYWRKLTKEEAVLESI